jgi:hypothetical protein
MAEKKNAKNSSPKATTSGEVAGLQFSVEADPFWAADLNDAGHTVALYRKTREQVETRAREILAGRSPRPDLPPPATLELAEAWSNRG